VFVCILPEKAVPEMTYTVSGGTMNLTNSLTCYGVVLSLMTFVTIRCQSTLSSELLRALLDSRYPDISVSDASLLFFSFPTKCTLLLSLCVQIKAVLSCYYKVYKDESVLVFNARENIDFYWNRLRQLLHLKVPEAAKEPEATLPPVPN